MDDLILRDVSYVGEKARDRFVWRCNDAFDRFVAAVEERFGVHAKKMDTSDETYGSLKDYPFFVLFKGRRNTGYEISGYIEDDEDNDRLEIRYYAGTTDKKDWRESCEGEDIIDWLDDKMVKKESHRLHRGRMLKEANAVNFVPYVIGREKFDGKWFPIIVYLNKSTDNYWYEAVCMDDEGVYHTELGKNYVLHKVKSGTEGCNPEDVEAVEDEFFGPFEVEDYPTRRVDSVQDLEEYEPSDRKLISRD